MIVLIGLQAVVGPGGGKMIFSYLYKSIDDSLYDYYCMHVMLLTALFFFLKGLFDFGTFGTGSSYPGMGLTVLRSSLNQFLFC